MPVQTEKNRLGDILYWEEENRFSREEVTILSGQSLSTGTVVGKITKSVPDAGTPDEGNTGDGTVTGVTGGSKTMIGTYVLECITAGTGNGVFKVIDPDGNRLDDAKAGSAYTSSHLNFTINVGTTDFAVGDKFTIEVTEGSNRVKQIDFSATDGSQEAYGILIGDYDASSGDVKGVAVVRDAVVNPDNLVWPDGATDTQKAGALKQLAARGIVTREGA